MSPRERIMMLRLYEKVLKNRDYADKIGVEISFEQKNESIKRNQKKRVRA